MCTTNPLWVKLKYLIKCSGCWEWLVLMRLFAVTVFDVEYCTITDWRHEGISVVLGNVRRYAYYYHWLSQMAHWHMHVTYMVKAKNTGWIFAVKCVQVTVKLHPARHFETILCIDGYANMTSTTMWIWWKNYHQISNTRHTRTQNFLSCSCPCPIHWSQVLSREWRCSWSSADRGCSNYIWVINSAIAYQGMTHINGLTVLFLFCGLEIYHT